jgi:hypothetical protein
MAKYATGLVANLIDIFCRKIKLWSVEHQGVGGILSVLDGAEQRVSAATEQDVEGTKVRALFIKISGSGDT